MKNNKTKRVNFSIPENIDKALSEYSKNNLIPKSALVTRLLEQFLTKKDKN